MAPTHVLYCPQANEPGGGENPPATMEAAVVAVERPFCVTLRYSTGDGSDEITVAHVPVARIPTPGCYTPTPGQAFPVGFVEALGAETGGMAEPDDDEQPTG